MTPSGMARTLSRMRKEKKRVCAYSKCNNEFVTISTRKYCCGTCKTYATLERRAAKR